MTQKFNVLRELYNMLQKADSTASVFKPYGAMRLVAHAICDLWSTHRPRAMMAMTFVMSVHLYIGEFSKAD